MTSPRPMGLVWRWGAPRQPSAFMLPILASAYTEHTCSSSAFDAADMVFFFFFYCTSSTHRKIIKVQGQNIFGKVITSINGIVNMLINVSSIFCKYGEIAFIIF